MTSPAVVRGIFFAVRDPLSRQLAAWRYSIDERIIRAQLARRGFALVDNVLTGQPMIRITEPPEPGTVVPHMGMTGGGFSYSFRVQDDGVVLTAECLSTGFPPVDVPGLEAFSVKLPGQPYLQMPFREGFEIAYPQETLRLQGEYLFGFWGTFWKMFHDWEWYSEDFDQYRFSFNPLSVGCLLSVTHLESGTMLDLTGNADF